MNNNTLQSYSLLSDLLIESKRNDQIALKIISDKEINLPEYFPVIRFEKKFNENCRVIGDGFQMLCQTTGSINNNESVGRCPDNNESYRIYGKDDKQRYYNYLVIEESEGYTLFGFTSCHRFAGFFEFTDGQVTAVLDGEYITLEPGEHHLESVDVFEGKTLAEVYEQFAAAIAVNHPPRAHVADASPIGWCSWYAYYAGVSAEDIGTNLDQMRGDLNDIEWVLLDDGYQAFMGDWLTPSERFTGGVKAVIDDIKARGKKPAIWMAPFIAEPGSAVFREHPEWFVRAENGQTLKAEDVTYGGWRCLPWLMLDTSQQAVCDHLTQTVKTMREEWGVALFKLDANYWGALKGKRANPQVTGIEAYRRGMEAIAKGAGDAWLLGCNAPMWPSLGMVDAMRVSDDVERVPHRFSQIARESFFRSWQHQQLWHIDPDCVTLTDIPGQETDDAAYQYHRDVVAAVGGLLLSGDPLAEMDSSARASFSRLIQRSQLTSAPVQFTDLSLNYGKLALESGETLHAAMTYLKDDWEPVTVTLESDKAIDWFDYWSGEKLNHEPQKFWVINLSSENRSQLIISK
ncbi:glycoside hydrolase family 36 protein [Enterovibrio paralichthyis]|uniref:glycoside hydrolase family 36 protein n=1 Tax=Enterovibrio paralichthyis TaxID=2853805 RepID=UPI001C4457A8|nr:alpha-galactosidase [Enterovibrio paralichthyis]MBV7299158.1 alpha-galactosidase [Enterovibrio paralichthyis]